MSYDYFIEDIETPDSLVPGVEDIVPILEERAGEASPGTPVSPPPPSALPGTMIRLDGTDPALPLDDLAPLREIVGDARIVALGEPTHGQREVFQLKHRIIQYLVGRLGFTTFALEASAVACREMSRYVLDGVGDPGRALKAQGFWTWYTDEVLDLLLWLRQWNVAHPDRPVDVAGVDIQEARSAYQAITRFLGEYDASLVVDYATGIDAIASINPVSNPYDPARHQRLLALLDALESDIHSLEDPTENEIVTAIDDILAMRQFMTLWKGARDDYGYANARDAAMADRTAALANAAPKARVALWAHNAHMSKSTQAYVPNRIVPMGMRLKTRWVNDYVGIGFLFGAGSYQAMIEHEHGGYRLGPVDVGPPPGGSLDASLYDASAAPASLLDLRGLPASLDDWLGQPRTVRSAGALALDSDRMETELDVVQCFDALAFVRETTTAIPL